MRLEEIYIKGFKSFAEGIRLRFKGGITAVVGPNGCGKSNFVDAIRWVLGEQKARVLRTERMQQLIFNGTKLRKPLNVAEVSLTLSQEEKTSTLQHSSLQLVRRIYRSGESEYAINGVPSRLRDITELLLDTGVSTDAYAIIELKMIEDILSDKEGTRRQLFEQAAGVAKFKLQKREALQKLTHTEGDIQRISDLCREMERNLSTLERQAEKAIYYSELKKKYVAIRVLQAKEESRSLEEKLQKLDLQAKEEEASASKWHGQLHKSEATHTSRKATTEQKEKELQARQRALHLQQQSEQLLRQKLEVDREKIVMLEERTKQHEQQIRQQRKEQDTRKTRCSNLLQSIQQAEERLQAEQQRLEESKDFAHNQKISFNDKQNRCKEAEDQLSHLQAKLQDLRSKYNVKEAQADGLLRQQRQIVSSSSTTTEEEETVRQQRVQLQTELQKCKSNLEYLSDEEQSATQKLTQFRNHYETTREALRSCEQRLREQYKSAEWLSEMQARMEGFPEAIQWLRSSSLLKAPLLMEILEIVPDYVAAITTYLSPYAQHFVLKKRVAAEEMINLLEKNKKGRGAFFVLEELPEIPLCPSTNGLMASSQVSCEDTYVPLREFLLAGVEIVNTTDRPMITGGHRAILAADGSWISKVGQLRGGYLGKETRRSGWGLISRLKSIETEVRTIEVQKKKLQNELSVAEEALRKASLESIQKKKASLQEELHHLSQTQAVHTARLAEYEAAKQRYIERKAQLSQEQNILKEEKSTLYEQISKLEQLESSQKQALTAFRATSHSTRSASSRAQEALHSLQLKYSDQKSEYLRITSEHKLHSDYLRAISKQIELEQKALQQVFTDITNLRAKEEKHEAQLTELHKKSEELETYLNQAEETYYASRHTLTEEEKELRHLQKKHSHAKLISTELRGEFTRLREQLNYLQKSVETDLGQSQTDLLPEAQKVAQKEKWHLQENLAMQEIIDELKAKLNSIGNVNPLAAESFQEMKQRYQFIIQEQEDLLKARSTLSDTLEEIEKTVSKRFMKAFLQIQSHFQDTFKHLFSKDDVCALRLTDEANPSESDVEIIAQPKGKRPLRIEQLSSGEKALTALALLVAIYLYKPAPFCILDEVDAPLDDANSEKFNRLIRSLSNHAQFILITHNKHSMRSSDILYGFTMAEVGVTRVLPVDLRTIK